MLFVKKFNRRIVHEFNVSHITLVQILDPCYLYIYIYIRALPLCDGRRNYTCIDLFNLLLKININDVVY